MTKTDSLMMPNLYLYYRPVMSITLLGVQQPVHPLPNNISGGTTRSRQDHQLISWAEGQLHLKSPGRRISYICNGGTTSACNSVQGEYQSGETSNGKWNSVSVDENINPDGINCSDIFDTLNHQCYYVCLAFLVRFCLNKKNKL